MKLRALAIDRSRTLDGDVPGLHREEQCPVAVVERCVAMQRDRVDSVIFFAIAAAEQCSTGGNVQRYIVLEFHSADDKRACRDEYGASAIGSTGIDRRL